jgi:putative PIN family toxin of toxin-antitoxin system
LIVLDTNIVLDLLVFEDPATVALALQLRVGLRWLSTTAMRDELERVLGYPLIARRLHARTMVAGQILAVFDSLAHLQPVPPKADITCKDPDDQKFIDLAVAHRCLLLSKDKAVLCMQKRLLARGAQAQPAIN